MSAWTMRPWLEARSRDPILSRHPARSPGTMAMWTTRPSTIDLTDDPDPEVNESFLLSLTSPTGGAVLAASAATTFIQNADGPGEVAFCRDSLRRLPLSGTEGESDIQVMVARSNGSEGEVSVSYVSPKAELRRPARTSSHPGHSPGRTAKPSRNSLTSTISRTLPSKAKNRSTIELTSANRRSHDPPVSSTSGHDYFRQ